MLKINKYSMKGEEIGTKTLPKSLFAVESKNPKACSCHSIESAMVFRQTDNLHTIHCFILLMLCNKGYIISRLRQGLGLFVEDADIKGLMNRCQDTNYSIHD